MPSTVLLLPISHITQTQNNVGGEELYLYWTCATLFIIPKEMGHTKQLHGTCLVPNILIN